MVRVVDMTELTTVADDDVFYTVDSSSSGTRDRKITRANILTGIKNMDFGKVTHPAAPANIEVGRVYQAAEDLTTNHLYCYVKEGGALVKKRLT